MQDLSVDKTVDGVNKSYLDPMVTSDVIMGQLISERDYNDFRREVNAQKESYLCHCFALCASQQDRRVALTLHNNVM